MPHYPTQTYSLYVYFKDKEGAAVNPDSNSCTIYDSAGVSQATPTLSLIETGKYEMNYNIPSDAIRGDWVILITADIGTYKGIKKFLFEVELK